MEVEVRIQSIDPGDAVRKYAARRIRFALGRFASRVGRVVIRISDVNGTRGGVEQCCHIRAVERVGQAFKREIQRLRDARGHRESARVP
jgi:hypothetical protein